MQAGGGRSQRQARRQEGRAEAGQGETPRGARALRGALVVAPLGSPRGGFRVALIQFAAACNETKCKSCGHSARIFCAYRRWLCWALRRINATRIPPRGLPRAATTRAPPPALFTHPSGRVALQVRGCGLPLDSPVPTPDLCRVVWSCGVSLLLWRRKSPDPPGFRNRLFGSGPGSLHKI